MYQGSSKDDGGIVGLVNTSETLDYDVAQESTRAEEALICCALDENDQVCELCLTSAINPEDGELMWCPNEDIAKIHRRTMSMSQMTSMLRDNRRNELYSEAIARVINNYKSLTNDESPLVLDIGSGTSLLSMLAARNGARVIGCEMFSAMASVGAENAVRNGYPREIIEIKPCKSTELVLQSEELGDYDGVNSVREKPAITVSELLDSALLGESCIFSHAHAISNIMERDDVRVPLSDRIVPHSGTIFVALVESEMVCNSASVCGLGLFETIPWRDDFFAPSCSGGRPLIPVHWDILVSRGGRMLSSVGTAMQVEFFHPLPDESNQDLEEAAVGDEDHAAVKESEPSLESAYPVASDINETVVQIVSAGAVHGVLMWWNLYLLSPNLDPERELMYSTKPKSCDSGLSSSDQSSWQDHWVQCVYPLPQPIACQVGDTLRIRAARDFVHVWLDAKEVHVCTSDQPGMDSGESANKRVRLASDDVNLEVDSSMTPAVEINVDEENDGDMSSQQQCCCGWHVLCGAERFQMLNDTRRNNIFENALQSLTGKLKHCTSASPAGQNIVLDIGDGSLLALAIGRLLQDGNTEEVISANEADLQYSRPRVVSVERKQFSRMFHSQLITANDLDNTVLIWDGVDVDEIGTLLADNEIDDEEESESAPNAVIPSIVALVSECFQYQLSSLLTWEAISFWYQRSSLRLQSLLAPSAFILPHKAIVMVAAVHLPDLHVSHGTLNSVCGFDHSAFDEQVGEWYTHTYPYKLGNYRKTLLTEPLAAIEIPYKTLVHDIHCREFTVPILQCEHLECHGVVTWVDYILIEEPESCSSTSSMSDIHSSRCRLVYWDGNDFPTYLTTGVKFFPNPILASNGNFLRCKSSFEVGNSDITFDFQIV